MRDESRQGARSCLRPGGGDARDTSPGRGGPDPWRSRPPASPQRGTDRPSPRLRPWSSVEAGTASRMSIRRSRARHRAARDLRVRAVRARRGPAATSRPGDMTCDRARYLPDARGGRPRRCRDRGRPDRHELELAGTRVTNRWSPQGDTWAGVGVYQPDALADAAPCSGDWQSRPASGTPAGPRPAARPGSRGAESSSHSRRPRRSATTPSTCGCGSTTSARSTSTTR